MPQHAGFNTSAFSRLQEALRILRDATDNPELQMQAVATFAYIAWRHPTEVPLGEIEKTLGLAQTTTSRNTSYLAKGDARGHGGYELIEVSVDPFYLRRKLCKLTPKGVKVASNLADVMGPG
jgi:DNA-binding MarR family transcriptional regulator